MSDSKARISPDRQATSPNGRRFLDDFKRDAVRLVVEEQYTFKAAAKAVGVSENIIEASWLALVDAIEYKLYKDETSSPTGQNSRAEAIGTS